MPGHYKKKPRKNSQSGGQMKKKLCMCSRNHHQMGGRLLTPAQLKLLQRQHPDFRTLPVRRKQKGMGHGCMCNQCGGNIFDDIGGAFKRTFSNPLRGLAAVSTMGLSETFLQPAEKIGKAVGVKPSVALEKAAPIIGAIGAASGAPELGKASVLTSKGLKMMGLGSSRRVIRQPILV